MRDICGYCGIRKRFTNHCVDDFEQRYVVAKNDDWSIHNLSLVYIKHDLAISFESSSVEPEVKKSVVSQ